MLEQSTQRRESPVAGLAQAAERTKVISISSHVAQHQIVNVVLSVPELRPVWEGANCPRADFFDTPAGAALRVLDVANHMTVHLELLSAAKAEAFDVLGKMARHVLRVYQQ